MQYALPRKIFSIQAVISAASSATLPPNFCCLFKLLHQWVGLSWHFLIPPQPSHYCSTSNDLHFVIEDIADMNRHSFAYILILSPTLLPSHFRLFEVVYEHVQCPNPDFNKPEYRWRMLQRSLVEAVTDLLTDEGKVHI